MRVILEAPTQRPERKTMRANVLGRVLVLGENSWPPGSSAQSLGPAWPPLADVLCTDSQRTRYTTSIVEEEAFEPSKKVGVTGDKSEVPTKDSARDGSCPDQQ